MTNFTRNPTPLLAAAKTSRFLFPPPPPFAFLHVSEIAPRGWPAARPPQAEWRLFSPLTHPRHPPAPHPPRGGWGGASADHDRVKPTGRRQRWGRAGGVGGLIPAPQRAARGGGKTRLRCEGAALRGGGGSAQPWGEAAPGRGGSRWGDRAAVPTWRPRRGVCVGEKAPAQRPPEGARTGNKTSAPPGLPRRGGGGTRTPGASGRSGAEESGGTAASGPAAARAAAERGKGGYRPLARPSLEQGGRRRSAGNSAQEVWVGGEGGPVPRPAYLKTQSSRASLAGEINPCFLLKSFWNRVGGILGRRRWAPAAEALGSAQRRPLAAASSARPTPFGVTVIWQKLVTRLCQKGEGGRASGAGRCAAFWTLTGCAGRPADGATAWSPALPWLVVGGIAERWGERGPAAAIEAGVPPAPVAWAAPAGAACLHRRGSLSGSRDGAKRGWGVSPRGWTGRGGGDTTPLVCLPSSETSWEKSSRKAKRGSRPRRRVFLVAVTPGL